MIPLKLQMYLPMGKLSKQRKARGVGAWRRNKRRHPAKAGPLVRFNAPLGH